MRRPTSEPAGWIVAAVLGALLAWYVLSDTPLRLGDRSLRVYDVRDLIVDVPDFHFGDEAVGTGDRAGSGESRDERVRELAEQIRTHVAPGTWGRDDVINFADGARLLIVTSEAKHRLVRDFFDQLRAGQRVQVTVEARFVSIGRESDRQLHEALAGLSNRPADGQAGTFLDDADVTALLRATQASSHASIVTAPRITLFNGQRAYALVGNESAYVASVTPSRSADGAVQHVPTLGTADYGVLLETRATASADRQHVTLYLHPRLRELVGMKTVRVGTGPDGKPLDVQRPEVWTAEVRKTLNIPDGKTLLIWKILKPAETGVEVDGQGNLRPGAKGGGGAGSGRPAAPEEVVLLVKAKIIDPSKPAAPAPAPAPAAPSPGAADASLSVRPAPPATQPTTSPASRSAGQ